QCCADGLVWAGLGQGLLHSVTAVLTFLFSWQAPVQLLPSSCDNPSLPESSNGLSTSISAPLPAPKPMVISLLEEGEEPWVPDVGSLEAVAGDVSPAGAGIRNLRKGLQEGGVVNRQCGSIDMEEIRRDVHVDQGQIEWKQNKMQQGKHLLKA
ncbi:hypothetical protein ASZ78_017081, partial [Callipepla squamata]